MGRLNYSFVIQAVCLMVAVVYPALLAPAIAVISATFLLTKLSVALRSKTSPGDEEEGGEVLVAKEERCNAFLRVNESIRLEIIPLFPDPLRGDMKSSAPGYTLGAANNASIANKATTIYNIGINNLNFAVRAKSSDSQNPKKVKLIRLGRALHQFHDTPFLSSIADNPVDEALLLSNGTSRPLVSSSSSSSRPQGHSLPHVRGSSGEQTNVTGTVDEGTLVSGDIVKVKLVDKRSRRGDRLLTVKEEWWVGAVQETTSSFFGGACTDDDPNQEFRSLFTITVVDEAGKAIYGTPLSSGQPFRLRSTRWPRYEVGYQLGEGDELLLYEWTPKHHKEPIKWQFGGLISPLVLCGLPRAPRESTRRTDYGKYIYFRLSTIFSKNRDLQLLELSLAGWGEVMHRSLIAPQKVVFIRLSYLSSAGRSHSDSICVRQDLVNLLQTLDEKVKFSAFFLKSARGVSTRAPIAPKHETPYDACIRPLRYKLAALQHYIRSGQRYSRDAAARLAHYCKEPQSWDSFLLAGPPSQLSRRQDMSCSVHIAVVLRASWSSNWNEEIAVLSPLKLDFHQPFSRSTALTVPLAEVRGVSRVPARACPLPGVHFLRVETMPRVHYIGFSTHAALVAMETALLDEVGHCSASIGKMDSLFFHSGRWLPKCRKVLNARRLAFDSTGPCGAALLLVAAASSRRKTEAYLEASYQLLKEVFEIDPLSNEDYKEQTINSRPVTDDSLDISRLTAFFDEVSALQMVDLSAIDCNSHDAICFFCNIYSILLMHARLVNGAPSTGAQWKMFFETFSYEIGEDVFSLCEIEQCVLRGLLCRPKYSAISDSRNIRPTVAADDDHFRYALPKADFRVNFLLTNGTVSYPNKIYLLTPASLERKLDQAAREMLGAAFRFDPAKKTIILPKICKYYCEDFGEDLVKKCMPYVTHMQDGAHLLKFLAVHGSSNMNIAYCDYFYQSHDRMKLIL